MGDRGFIQNVFYCIRRCLVVLCGMLPEDSCVEACRVAPNCALPPSSGFELFPTLSSVSNLFVIPVRALHTRPLCNALDDHLLFQGHMCSGLMVTTMLNVGGRFGHPAHLYSVAVGANTLQQPFNLGNNIAS